MKTKSSKVTCIICGNKATQSLFKARDMHGNVFLSKDSFEYFQCLTCYAIFTHKIKINAQYYKKYYPQNYYKPAEGGLHSLVQFLTRFSIKVRENRIVNAVDHLKRPLRILDIGAGDGTFLDGLSKETFHKEGIEFDGYAVKLAQKKGLNVKQADILKEKLNKNHDVITLWHVIEHLEDPLILMKKLESIMGKNTRLFISTPNTKSLGFWFGKGKWFHFDAPRHLVLFESRTIARLAERSKLKVVREFNDYFDFPTDLFWSIQNPWLRVLLLPIYPLLKITSRETITYILAKEDI